MKQWLLPQKNMLTKELFSRIMKLLRSNLKLGSLHEQAESKRIVVLTHGFYATPDLDNANVGKY